MPSHQRQVPRLTVEHIDRGFAAFELAPLVGPLQRTSAWLSYAIGARWRCA